MVIKAGELGMKRFAMGSALLVGIAAFEAKHDFFRSLFRSLLATKRGRLAECMVPRRAETAGTAVPTEFVCRFSKSELDIMLDGLSTSLTARTWSAPCRVTPQPKQCKL